LVVIIIIIILSFPSIWRPVIHVWSRHWTFSVSNQNYEKNKNYQK